MSGKGKGMNVKEALVKGTQILKEANIETPAVDAGVILCHVLKKDRAYIYTHNDEVMEETNHKCFFDLIGERAEGKPVQYIAGQQEFMSLNFKVAPGILIPRHDTEVLVETVLERLKTVEGSRLQILDIGTGSGCIAVSIAYYCNKAFITAVDISEKALEIAELNARNNEVETRISFIRSNLFGQINVGHTFDVIVSNPPYIPSYDISGLQREVKDYEPITALDGGNDGLDFYRSIIKGSLIHLKENGLLAFEVGYNQAEDVARLMSNNYREITFVKDLSGIDRVVLGNKK